MVIGKCHGKPWPSSLLEAMMSDNLNHTGWMESLFELLQDKTLSQLVIPGSHDTGMYRATGGWKWGKFKPTGFSYNLYHSE
jgi:hypothetical protein